jgi:hypothetical protein
MILVFQVTKQRENVKMLISRRIFYRVDPRLVKRHSISRQKVGGYSWTKTIPQNRPFLPNSNYGEIK